jgi:hypothetical protein
MAGTIFQTRRGKRSDNPQGGPITQQQTSGSKPKPMTVGEAKPASAWKK